MKNYFNKLKKSAKVAILQNYYCLIKALGRRIVDQNNLLEIFFKLLVASFLTKIFITLTKNFNYILAQVKDGFKFVSERVLKDRLFIGPLLIGSINLFVNKYESKKKFNNISTYFKYFYKHFNKYQIILIKKYNKWCELKLLMNLSHNKKLSLKNPLLRYISLRNLKKKQHVIQSYSTKNYTNRVRLNKLYDKNILYKSCKYDAIIRRTTTGIYHIKTRSDKRPATCAANTWFFSSVTTWLLNFKFNNNILIRFKRVSPFRKSMRVIVYIIIPALLYVFFRWIPIYITRHLKFE